MGHAREAVDARGDELLERGAPLDSLEGWLADARAGRGRLVLLSGEAGVGKTALVRQFCDRQEPDLRLLWGACDSLRTPRPLGPFADVAADAGGALLDAVRRGEKPAGCFAALAEELDLERPTILVLEDLHWADEATLDVLTMLARRAERFEALTIATYRDDAVGPGDPLRAVLGELQQSSGVLRLSLAPLSELAVTRLARPHGIDGAALYRRTGGNPFFVTEVLSAAGPQLPATVRDAVLARAAQLGEGAIAVLEAVSVNPERAEVWLLEDLVGGGLEHLNECLASGMLRPERQAVAFRHELARQAVEESIAPHRYVALHRDVLASLRCHADAEPDPARLAHHAEEAGDGAAVLEFAPVAAARASVVGAHREAAAQYARALRFAGSIESGARADLLELRSDECHMSADFEQAVTSLEDALACHRAAGDRRREGIVLRSISRTTYCMGGGKRRSNEAIQESIEVLETLPPGPELARAYLTMASACMNAEDAPGTFRWAGKAARVAEQLDDPELRVISLNELGTMEFLQGMPEGRAKLERSLALALEHGFEEHAGRAFIHLMWASTRTRRYDLAAGYATAGVDYCIGRGLDLHAHYVYAYRARAELDLGDWDAAAESATLVTSDPRSAPDALAPALVVLGLVRARRGDPGHWAALDAATELIDDADLQRTAPVAAALAEALWLEDRVDEIDAATAPALAAALEHDVRWVVGELAAWRRRAGLRDDLPEGGAAEPYASSQAGDWVGADAGWRELGCAYEAALALADSDDEDVMLRAHEQLRALGAEPSAAVVARQLRLRGTRGLPRGPRPRTQANPGGLTPREVEVAALLVEGLRNRQIAERLVVSEKTVDHHVSAILRKLGTPSRAGAAAAAARLGLAGPSST